MDKKIIKDIEKAAKILSNTEIFNNQLYLNACQVEYKKYLEQERL